MQIPPLLTSITSFAASLLVCYTLTPKVMAWAKRRGITGKDIHKPDKPTIPEMGGIAILIGLTVSSCIASLLDQPNIVEYLAFILTVHIAGAVGAIDDFKPIGPRLKPVLAALAAAPIYLLRTYSPRPILPVIGRVRLTIAYPLLLPFAISIPANAVNMVDVMNGTMAGTSILTLAAMIFASLLLGRWDAVILCSGLIGSLAAFYAYNRNPARVFPGDVGTLSVGAAIGATAIIGGAEVVTIVAMMPQIMNAFYGLSSVGRLYDRTRTARPISLRDDGMLTVSRDRQAPITLTRIILARGPMREEGIFRSFMTLSAISCSLAILTAVLLWRV
jgi:UDP-N-acetylglucosamine--dolichyl-phosphate N-acetylglucosaminephosphotransferase